MSRMADTFAGFSTPRAHEGDYNERIGGKIVVHVRSVPAVHADT